MRLFRGYVSCGGSGFCGDPGDSPGNGRGFHVVTAHNQRDKLAEIDFQAMAKGRIRVFF